MTTIAYKNGWLVSDSRECFKDRIDTDKSKKIWRLSDWSIFGGAGNSTGIEQLRGLLVAISKQKKKTLPNQNIKGTQAILFDGRYAWYYEYGCWSKLDSYYAIGSGSDYAIAAMDAGCSAEEAVRVACKRDAHSGGRIQKLKYRY